jgi:hypothetical protein
MLNFYYLLYFFAAMLKKRSCNVYSSCWWSVVIVGWEGSLRMGNVSRESSQEMTAFLTTVVI